MGCVRFCERSNRKRGGGPTYLLCSLQGTSLYGHYCSGHHPRAPGSDLTYHTDLSLNRITTLACSTISFENNVSYFILVVCASRESPYCRLWLMFCSDLNNTSHISLYHILHLNVTSTWWSYVVCRMSCVKCIRYKRVRKIVRHFESHKTKIQKSYHVPGTSQVPDFSPD